MTLRQVNLQFIKSLQPSEAAGMYGDKPAASDSAWLLLTTGHHGSDTVFLMVEWMLFKEVKTDS